MVPRRDRYALRHRGRAHRQEVRRLHRRRRCFVQRERRRDLRPARSERSGKVDADPHDDHADSDHVGHALHRRPRCGERSECGAAHDRRDPAGADQRSRPYGGRESEYLRQAVRRAGERTKALHRRAARAGGPNQVARRADQDPLRRHAAAAGDRARAGASSAKFFFSTSRPPDWIRFRAWPYGRCWATSKASASSPF